MCVNTVCASSSVVVELCGLCVQHRELTFTCVLQGVASIPRFLLLSTSSNVRNCTEDQRTLLVYVTHYNQQLGDMLFSPTARHTSGDIHSSPERTKLTGLWLGHLPAHEHLW